jgi:hypothetical protein
MAVFTFVLTAKLVRLDTAARASGARFPSIPGYRKTIPD